MVRNLVDNAMRHARHSVTIRLGARGGHGEIVVGSARRAERESR
ncbi:hypothetical protein AB0368_24575 [Actinoplanes sp. NPDC051475]